MAELKEEIREKVYNDLNSNNFRKVFIDTNKDKDKIFIFYYTFTQDTDPVVRVEHGVSVYDPIDLLFTGFCRICTTLGFKERLNNKHVYEKL